MLRFAEQLAELIEDAVSRCAEAGEPLSERQHAALVAAALLVLREG
ncbi:MAG: hypothetical protein WBB74_09690 [Gaiellaceae bacterium]